METVTIILNNEEAEKYKLFQKHYALFSTLQQKGVFDVQFGKCVLNIAFGQIQNIVKEEIVWKK